MSIVEIIAPTNKTLTTKIFAKGSDVVIETINLTENANSKGIYTGTVSTNLSGFHKAVVFENAESILVNDILFDGSERLYSSDSLPLIKSIYDRIVFTVPDGPAVTIPAPSSNNVTVAYSYCYDVHGVPVAGVPITIKLMEVITPLPYGSYLSDEFTFYSDQYGVAYSEIPRGTSFRFRTKSGKNGAWIEFRGVDADSLQLPFLINK